MKTFLILTALLLLAASVSADELSDMADAALRDIEAQRLRQEIRFQEEILQLQLPPGFIREFDRYSNAWFAVSDTARFYARVDTVYRPSRAMKMCAVLNCYCKPVPLYVDTILDTTWLPKVQIWLMPDEAEIIKRMVCIHSWLKEPPPGTGYGIFDKGKGPKCKKCGKRK